MADAIARRSVSRQDIRPSEIAWTRVLVTNLP